MVPLLAGRGGRALRVILRTGRVGGIGRATYFATTSCLTAQRVAAARLDTPSFV
jgi:hypothetical protein